MNERFMLQVDGKPLVADDGIFKLCENTECKVKISFLTYVGI